MENKIMCANKVYNLESSYDRYLLHELITDFCEDNLDYLSKKYKIGKAYERLGCTKAFFIEINQCFNLDAKDYNAIFEEVEFIEEINKIQKMISNKEVSSLLEVKQIKHRYNNKPLKFTDHNYQVGIKNDSFLDNLRHKFNQVLNLI